MSDVFIGQISMFGGSFAPKGFAFCNGQLLPINQNQALFALLGTTYGGDGRATFALPDLRSRLPLDSGQGPGLSNYMLGQTGGSSSVTLDVTTIPGHMHSLNATQSLATVTTIASNVIPAQATGDSTPLFYAAMESNQPALTFFPMAADACGAAGGSQPHTNLMPSLCITFIIALVGIFPSRN